MKPLKQLQNRHNLAHLFPMTTCFFLFTILTLVQPVSGQTKVLGDNVVERVVALVGDSVILMTELDEYLMTLEAGGWTRPDDPEELLTVKTQVLDQLVNQQLILFDRISLKLWLLWKIENVHPPAGQ